MSVDMKRNYIITFVLVVLGFLFLYLLNTLGIISRYAESVLILSLINIILATSLNITVGILGEINLGHAGFMSIGAYTAAIFMKAQILPGLPGYFVSLLLGGLLAGLVGILIGLPVLRLKGDYLAIVTLAFGEIIRVLIENMKITGGAQGLAGIPTMKSFPIIYFLTVICVVLMYSTMTSRHGRAILAIRDNDLAAQSSGVNVTYYKTFAFAFSAFFGGVAGAIYAQNIGVIGAQVFDYNYSFDILVMVVLGGMGSFTGAIISAMVLTILPESLRAFADLRMIIYSIILILVMLFRPSGLLGRSEFSLTRALNKLVKRKRRSEE